MRPSADGDGIEIDLASGRVRNVESGSDLQGDSLAGGDARDPRRRRDSRRAQDPEQIVTGRLVDARAVRPYSRIDVHDQR